MGATVIDGKALAAATKPRPQKGQGAEKQGHQPCLAVILVGENPASQVYVRGKINDCAQCGIEPQHQPARRHHAGRPAGRGEEAGG